MYLKQDSVFDADLESTLIDFVLVYENNTKKKKVGSETSVTNSGSNNNGDEKEVKRITLIGSMCDVSCAIFSSKYYMTMLNKEFENFKMEIRSGYYNFFASFNH